MSTIDLINEFLACKRIAMAGVSSNETEFSRNLMREFIGRGYDIVPVHPSAENIEGRKCYKNMAEIESAVDAALIITRPEATVSVLSDCHRTGISLVWIYRAIGQGSMSGEALEFARQKNIRVVPGYCPFMFLSDPGFIHRIHRFFMKVRGTYPS